MIVFLNWPGEVFDIILMVSIILNIVLLYLLFDETPDPEFDQMTAISLRLAEREHLTVTDRLGLAYQELKDLNPENIDEEVLENFQRELKERGWI